MPRLATYIDSCVWIANYKPTEKLTGEQRAGIATLLDDVSSGNVVLVASSILLVEALTVSAEDIELAFDGRKGILVAADESICGRARALELKCYKDTGRVLAPMDAIHLSTAAVMGCQRFVTLDRKQKDKQLAPLADRDHLERLLGIKILAPQEVNDQGQFDFTESLRAPSS